MSNLLGKLLSYLQITPSIVITFLGGVLGFWYNSQQIKQREAGLHIQTDAGSNWESNLVKVTECLDEDFTQSEILIVRRCLSAANTTLWQANVYKWDFSLFPSREIDELDYLYMSNFISNNEGKLILKENINCFSLKELRRMEFSFFLKFKDSSIDYLDCKQFKQSFRKGSLKHDSCEIIRSIARELLENRFLTYECARELRKCSGWKLFRKRGLEAHYLNRKMITQIQIWSNVSGNKIG